MDECCGGELSALRAGDRSSRRHRRFDRDRSDSEWNNECAAYKVERGETSRRSAAAEPRGGRRQLYHSDVRGREEVDRYLSGDHWRVGCWNRGRLNQREYAAIVFPRAEG